MAPKRGAGNQRVTRGSSSKKGKNTFPGEDSKPPKRSKVTLVDEDDEESESPTAETPNVDIIGISDDLESDDKVSISFKSPVFKARYEKSLSKKRMIYEKPVDIPLFTQINIINMFTSLGLEPVINPPKLVYPHLVREFYANLCVDDNQMILTEIRGKGFMADPKILGFLLNIPCDGPNPFTRNTPCTVFANMPIEQQTEIICGKPPPYPEYRPCLSELTPNSSLLLKVIHSNLVPRGSSRDKVTYLDIVLLACLQTETPFNLAALMIDHMSCCVEHQTKSLPYSALLTKIFEFMKVFDANELAFNLRECIDSGVLHAANLVVGEDGHLVWATVPTSITDTMMDPPVGPSKDPVTQLSLYQIERACKDNTLALEEIKIKQATYLKKLDKLSEYTQKSFEDVTGQLLKLEKILGKNKKLVEFEFASFQDGLVRTANTWNHELLKLAVNNSKELMFLSKQICGSSPISSEHFREWHEFNWLAEKPRDDLFPKLALPKIPPAEVFGLSREEYNSKVTAWLAARDGIPPSKINLSEHFMDFDDATTSKNDEDPSENKD